MPATLAVAEKHTAVLPYPSMMSGNEASDGSAEDVPAAV